MFFHEIKKRNPKFCIIFANENQKYHGVSEVQDLLKENQSPAAEFNVNLVTAFSVIVREPTDDNAANVGKDGNVTKDVTKELTDRQRVIIKMIREDAYVTTYEMSQKTGVVTRTVKRDLEYLQSAGIIIRIGGRKDGHWEILISIEGSNK